MSTPNQIAADLLGLGAKGAAAVHGVTVAYGARLQNAVQRNASGRPGPNAPTGNYRRSIHRRTVKRATTSESTTSSAAPQSARLELGFTGTDALGRNYNQPPFPHFGPALDELEPLFEKAVKAAAWPGA